MSSECETCGEYASECRCEKNQFYFKGKWFDTLEDMFKYSFEWRQTELNQESAKIELENLSKEIIINTFLFGPKMTNAQFSQLCKDILIFAHAKLSNLSNSEQ